MRSRLLAALAAAPVGIAGPQRICAACVQVLPVDGAALGTAAASTEWEVLAAHGELAQRFEAMQATVGEGPGIAAAAGWDPVLLDDLAVTASRWPLLAATLDARDVGAVYALPLQIGAARLGALDLYRDTPGSLEDAEVVAALVAAQTVARIMVSDRDGNALVAGQWWTQSPSSQQIHQASGMVMVQLGVPVGQAYARLQAHAFARGLSLAEVAHQVVARRLRFDPTAEDPG